jgi:hypothetical protein
VTDARIPNRFCGMHKPRPFLVSTSKRIWRPRKTMERMVLVSEVLSGLIAYTVKLRRRNSKFIEIMVLLMVIMLAKQKTDLL